MSSILARLQRYFDALAFDNVGNIGELRRALARQAASAVPKGEAEARNAARPATPAVLKFGGSNR